MTATELVAALVQAGTTSVTIADVACMAAELKEWRTFEILMFGRRDEAQGGGQS